MKCKVDEIAIDERLKIGSTPALRIANGSEERKPCCEMFLSARNGAMLKV